jgi:hypothetical protein
MGQDLCVVRRHIREDLRWMAEIGTDSVAVGIHEFQLDYGNQHQLDILFDEARRAGLDVHAIPSRWGGLVAGWPPAAGMFAATHPDSWMKRADGSPIFEVFCGGAICSIYDPETQAFFLDTIGRLLKQWPVRGIIWDEIKILHVEDYSRHAIRALGEPARGAAQIRNTVDFFSRANRHALSIRPELVLSCFLYAYLPTGIMNACATMAGLDYFGIDGRCWPDRRKDAKVLFGNIKRVEAACRKTGTGKLALVETQNLVPGEADRCVRHLPAFLRHRVDHLLYYYHGASTVDEDRCMDGMAPFLKAWRTP